MADPKEGLLDKAYRCISGCRDCANQFTNPFSGDAKEQDHD